MQQLVFTNLIQAPREKVWRVLFEDATYRQWTSVFAEGSYAQTDWKEGSRALFLSGTGEGMVSRIAEHRPNEYMSIEHLGVVKGGVEDTESEELKAWAGACENYRLEDVDGHSKLTVEMQSTDEYADYFKKTWPKALDKVKELAEASVSSRHFQTSRG